MDRARLEALLAVRGAGIASWPAPLRREAADLLDRDPRARDLLAEAQALDALLDLLPEPDDAGAARVMRAVATRLAEETRPQLSFLSFAWRPTAAIFASLLMAGLLFGWAVLPGSADAASALIAGAEPDSLPVGVLTVSWQP